MYLKWTSKALSDLARLYDFMAPVNNPAAARTVQALAAAPSALYWLTHASANGLMSSSRTRCAGFSLGITRCAMNLRKPPSTCCGCGTPERIADRPYCRPVSQRRQGTSLGELCLSVRFFPFRELTPLRASSGVPLDYPGSFCGQALAQPGALPEFGDGFQSDNTTQSLRANIPAREIPCAPAEDHRKIGESLLQRMLTKNEHCQSRVSRVIRNDTLTTSRVTPTAL